MSMIVSDDLPLQFGWASGIRPLAKVSLTECENQQFSG